MHRITPEDAEYIASECCTSYNLIANKDCYILINKKNGKMYTHSGDILVYKAGDREEPDNKKKRFLQAVEACAYFRGYANANNIKFKNPCIADLFDGLEDDEVETPKEFNECYVVTVANLASNREAVEYIAGLEGVYDLLYSLERNLPTLALVAHELNPLVLENAEQEEELDEDDEHDWEDDEFAPFY